MKSKFALQTLVGHIMCYQTSGHMKNQNNGDKKLPDTCIVK